MVYVKYLTSGQTSLQVSCFPQKKRKEILQGNIKAVSTNSVRNKDWYHINSHFKIQEWGPLEDSSDNNRYLATRQYRSFWLQSTFDFIISFYPHSTPGRQAISIIVVVVLYYYYSHYYEEMAIQRPQSRVK